MKPSVDKKAKEFSTRDDLAAFMINDGAKTGVGFKLNISAYPTQIIFEMARKSEGLLKNKLLLR